jgi:phosphoribosylglycinamide formyltransferase-1
VSNPASFAVFISGRGSNLNAILRDVRLPQPSLVVSSKRSAQGLGLATEAGVPISIVRKRDFPAGDFARGLIDACESAGVRWIVLAGFMVILPTGFLDRFAGRIVNIHPSLLPLFPGLHPHQQALDAGVEESGCTVHLVEPGDVDGGRVLAQAKVPVRPGDNEDTLAARVLGEEHKLYPETLVRLFAGEY